jgi:hypothetical protein
VIATDEIKSLPNFAAPVAAFALELLESELPVEKESYFLLGNDTSVAPMYYKMTLWCGAKDTAIDLYESRFDLEIPEYVRVLLQAFNGLSLLGMSIYGIPESMLRNTPQIDRKSRQCLDIGTANKYWINEYSLNEKMFLFGGRHFSETENAGYFINTNGDILSYLTDGTLIDRWPNLKLFFESEVAAVVEYENSKS